MVHPTSVTNTIDRLERQEFVVRRPNPADRRGTLAEITPAGRRVVEQATADLVAAGFGMDGYGERELEEMFTLLRGLRVNAGDFRESRGAGLVEPGDAIRDPGASGGTSADR